MRPIFLVAGLLGATTALTVNPRQPEGDIASFEVERGRGIEKRQDGERGNRRNRSPRRDDDWSGSDTEEEEEEEKKGKEVKWKPKTKNPHFFNLVVDYDDCDFYDPNGDCPFWWPFCHNNNKRLGKRQGGPGGPGGPGGGPGGPGGGPGGAGAGPGGPGGGTGGAGAGPGGSGGLGGLGGVLGGILGAPGGPGGAPSGPGGAPGGPGILGGPGGPGGGSGGPGVLGGPGGPGGGSGGPGVLGGPGGPGGGSRGPGVLDGVLGGPGGPGVLGGVLGGPGGPGVLGGVLGGPRGPGSQGGPGALGGPEELSTNNGWNGWGSCERKLKNYVIILNYGKVLAVPYKPWFRGKLATFFVDDDTRLFTVSKQPLSIYVDRIDAQLLYTNVGWLPPNAAATGFYQLGTNPERKIPSPAYLTWPITYGLAFPEWVLCEIGSTGHYEIFANPQNWRSNEPQGLLKADQFKKCFAAPLATFNTNPWKGY